MTATEPNADVRRGLPSASALPRLSKCAASFLLSKEAKRQGIVEPENDDATSGTRIHRWLETRDEDDWSALSEDEQKTADMCHEQAERLFNAWRAGIFSTRLDHNERNEARLYLLADGSRAVLQPSDGVGCIFSGQADRLYSAGDDDEAALVIDWKTGRTEYEPAAGNAQLAGLAVLASLWTGACSVRVAIAQPWAGKPSIADFDAPALDEAKCQLLALLKHIEEPGLVPVVGDWCRWCPAKLICPALNEECQLADNLTDSVARAKHLAKHVGGRKEVEAMVAARLDGPALGFSLQRWKRIEWFGDALKAEAKRRLESNSPDAPEGWCLTDGRKTRTITNLAEAFGILNAEFGMTPERMMAACKASLPDIEADVAKHGGIPKTQAPRQVADALVGLIEYGKTAPSLAEKKPERAEIEGATA